MEILNHVDRLESLATSAGRVPKTRKVLMDLDKVLELVDQIRLDIPKDIQEAEEVLEKREALINQSLMDARRIKASNSGPSSTCSMRRSRSGDSGWLGEGSCSMHAGWVNRHVVIRASSSKNVTMAAS